MNSESLYGFWLRLATLPSSTDDWYHLRSLHVFKHTILFNKATIGGTYLGFDISGEREEKAIANGAGAYRIRVMA